MKIQKWYLKNINSNRKSIPSYADMFKSFVRSEELQLNEYILQSITLYTRCYFERQGRKVAISAQTVKEEMQDAYSNLTQPCLSTSDPGLTGFVVNDSIAVSAIMMFFEIEHSVVSTKDELQKIYRWAP
jgi:hypothetical protein